jgi:hypothetical protein
MTLLRPGRTRLRPQSTGVRIRHFADRTATARLIEYRRPQRKHKPKPATTPARKKVTHLTREVATSGDADQLRAHEAKRRSPGADSTSIVERLAIRKAGARS